MLTFKPGVAEAMPPDFDRTGTVERIGSVEVGEEPIRVEREIPADPSEVDIRHADRIVAGGRGLGGADGFQRLARVARVLKAAVAASRVAVDLGWIDRERQVGQTGKTIAPALYLACGISGASHHLAGDRRGSPHRRDQYRSQRADLQSGAPRAGRGSPRSPVAIGRSARRSTEERGMNGSAISREILGNVPAWLVGAFYALALERSAGRQWRCCDALPRATAPGAPQSRRRRSVSG